MTKLVRYVSGIFLYFAVVLLLFAMVIHVTVTDGIPYTYYIDETSFKQRMVPLIREAVEDECLFYGIPSQLFDSPPFYEQLYRSAQQQIDHVQAVIQSGAASVFSPMDDSLYCAAVETYFCTLPIEQRPSEISIVQSVGKTIAQTAYNTVKLSIPSSVTTQIGKVVNHPAIKTVVVWWPIWAAVALLSVVVNLRIYCNCRTKILYRLSLITAVACASVFVPLWLLYLYDVPAKISLGESMLSWCFDTIYTGKVDQLLCLTGVIVVLAAACLVTVIVFVTKTSQRRD